MDTHKTPMEDYNDAFRRLFTKKHLYETCTKSKPSRSASSSGNTHKTHKKAPRNKTEPLKPSYLSTASHEIYELGIDEAGRGPMFGPLYVACVVLPSPDSDFCFSDMKDSKRFHSVKKIQQVATYIREHAVAYSVQSASPAQIDSMNIRQAVLHTMHKCIDDVAHQLLLTPSNCFLLVDGCDFEPYHTFPHVTIEGGDNWYCSIAGASILAKVARDQHISELCEAYPLLDERYGLLKNKGYGTRQHMEGIRTYGITQWHRKTFGLCKESKVYHVQ